MKTAPCEGCNNPHTDYGFALDISGGYAQFTDCFGEDPSPNHYLRLCHDCVLRLVELFPIMRSKLNGGCHPYTGETPCCEFGWTA